MAVSRERLLAEGEASTQAALGEISRVANATHSQLICEAIRNAILTIEGHRHTCKVINEFCPAMEPIRNDDLAPALRLRLRLLAALREYEND